MYGFLLICSLVEAVGWSVRRLLAVIILVIHVLSTVYSREVSQPHLGIIMVVSLDMQIAEMLL